MTVEQLIRELQRQDLNATVVIVIEDVEDDGEIRSVEKGDGGEVWLY
jgi:hypothetical protein